MTRKLTVCAVSYLNTSPLVWGMLHGAQQGIFHLIFRLPSQCADLVAAGEADIGIVPSFELLRHDFGIVPGLGIASRGEVRSVFLVSKKPAPQIRTLAADVSSRTSVALARVILAEKHGVVPAIHAHPPQLEAMLAQADAAVLIGDPALRLDPETLPFHVYDLGREWTGLTGLPMVYAVWAGPKRHITPPVIEAFQQSCRYGATRISEIVELEAAQRGFAPDLASRYLTEHTVVELNDKDLRGLERFLALAATLAGDTARASVTI